MDRSYGKPRSSNTLHVLSGAVFRLCERININTTAILLSGGNKGQRGDAVTDLLLLHKSVGERTCSASKTLIWAVGGAKCLSHTPL